MIDIIFNLQEPKFWITLAFILLVAFSARTVSRLIAGVLDGHAQKIKDELAVASTLRAEAEQILEIYKQKQAEFTREAELIIAKAKSDAEANTNKAQIELKSALDARLKQALEKIAQEEAAAVAEVRNHVVDLTLSAARKVVSEQMNKSAQGEMIKKTVSDFERKLH